MSQHRLFKRVENPGARSAHTKKWDDCVRDVKRSGSKVSPYAVCSSAIGYEGSVRKGHRRRNPTRQRYQIFVGESQETMHYFGTKPNYSDAMNAAREYQIAHPYVRTEVRMHPDDKPGRPAHRKLLRELEQHFSMDEKDLKRMRKENPLPKLSSVRAVYYVVSASKGREQFFLKRSGKLTRNAVDAARFRTTKEAVDKAKAHLAKYPASRKFRFDVKIAY